MADSSRSEFDSSHTSVDNRERPADLTRRKFLKGAGKASVGIVTELVTGIPPLRALERLAGSNNSAKKNETKSQIASSQTPSTPLIESNQDRISAFSLFHDLTPDDAKEINDRVNSFVMEIVGQGETPRLREKAGQYLKLVYQHAQEDGFMAQNMMGIILTESRFDPNAANVVNVASGAKAVGLCGLKEEVATDYHLEVSAANDQRLDPKRNIEVASKYMGDNKRLFVDESLAIWAHHAGPGHVMDAISIEINDPTFNLEDYGNAIEKKDSKERERIERLVADYIRRNNLNFYKLMKNEKVVSWVRNNKNLEDETLNYPYRVLAGAVVLGYAKF